MRALCSHLQAPPRDWAQPYEGGVLDASSWGAACPQADDPDGIIVPQLWNLSRTSESCLYLNVWRPSAIKRAAAPNLPMLVFIHGGGYTQGCSDLYNGSSLASRHNVVSTMIRTPPSPPHALSLRHGTQIVVTLNYRLGVLGFWPFREHLLASQPTGNFGLLDQQSGLRWLLSQSTAIGADHQRVLLFGQSAGAASVAAHLAMPGSRGLFTRAGLESGAASGTGNLSFALRRTGVKNLRALMRRQIPLYFAERVK
eukprot:COSAG05_NODE_953_length_6443_cov_14.987390_10_plen_255_part_00